MLFYRDEIDGLRAIAVMPVILYHAGCIKFMPGGYIGVDVFFVISGYLITSVIENEREEGTFSLVRFYERRCRRILPALFFILFISSIFAYHWTSPGQLKDFGQSLISIIALSSNIFFWWKDDDYFIQLTEVNPLVHTWSLAVEEQFYLIFPLICYLSGKKKCHLINLLICLALFSFFLAQWGGNFQSISDHQFQMFFQHSWASFYLPIGRAWELLLGSFAAFYLRLNSSVSETLLNKCNEFFAVVGLVLIILSVLFFDANHIPPFPNCYTLIPTLGTTLIILFGTKNTLVGRLLCLRLLRWIGLISYSAYLWHQPLLVFYRLRFNKTLEILPVLVIASTILLLSSFSYVVIEQPFRHKKLFSRKQIFSASCLTAIMIFILAVFLIQTATNRTLLLNKQNDSYLSDIAEYPGWKSTAKEFFDLEKNKTFSNRSLTKNKKLILIGDSYATDFYSMIIEGKHLVNYEIRVHFIPAQCQIYLSPENPNQFIDGKFRQTCFLGNDIIHALPLICQADVIMLSSNWLEWSTRKLPRTLKLLNLTKQQQIFVIGPKHFGKVNTNLYVNKSTEYRIKQYQYPDQSTVKVNSLLEQIIDKSIFVNILKMLCIGHNQTCPLFTPYGKIISIDGYHLTKSGALYVGNIIFKNEPLNKL
ncbi:unnamed protein product [Rotaria sp. Silwood2]|nr:unnamed protein product [Rotaria sp. Silwood2]CAF4607974.1 unnamed protein product [Rotaria sp. Silwood2]